jgi:hypothetical protein
MYFSSIPSFSSSLPSFQQLYSRLVYVLDEAQVRKTRDDLAELERNFLHRIQQAPTGMRDNRSDERDRRTSNSLSVRQSSPPCSSSAQIADQINDQYLAYTRAIPRTPLVYDSVNTQQSSQPSQPLSGDRQDIDWFRVFEELKSMQKKQAPNSPIPLPFSIVSIDAPVNPASSPPPSTYSPIVPSAASSWMPSPKRSSAPSPSPTSSPSPSSSSTCSNSLTLSGWTTHLKNPVPPKASSSPKRSFVPPASPSPSSSAGSNSLPLSGWTTHLKNPVHLESVSAFLSSTIEPNHKKRKYLLSDEDSDSSSPHLTTTFDDTRSDNDLLDDFVNSYINRKPFGF